MKVNVDIAAAVSEQLSDDIFVFEIDSNMQRGFADIVGEVNIEAAIA